MATYYFRNTGDVNWGTATNWSLTDGGGATGAVPTSADDVFFTANSGNCDVNTSSRSARNVNFTGYTNTITLSANLITYGNVTLGASMGIGTTGSGELATTTNNATFTSNGKVWTYGIRFTGNSTTVYTLADNWTVTGNLFFSGATLNGNTLYVNGNLTLGLNSQVFGTTLLYFNGTTTFTNSGGLSFKLSMTFNTTGIITLSSLPYNTGTITYIANTGSVVTTGTTLTISTGGATLNTSGMNWENITTSGSADLTLLSNLNINGNFIAGASTGAINGLYNVNIKGNITLNNVLSGTATIVLNGTGSQSWTHSTSNYLSNNLTINKPSGTLTLGANVYYNTGTLTYIAGTVNTAGSTLNSNLSTTFATNGINWNNVTLSGTSQTFTFSNNLTVSNILSLSGATAMTLNSNNIFITGNLSVTTTATISGTTLITFNGTGNQTWNHAAVGYLGTSVTINKASGTLTLGANVYISGGTFTYTQGDVDLTTNNNVFNVIGGTFNTNGLRFNTFLFATNGANTITLASDLYTNTFTAGGNGVINGVFNTYCNTLNINNSTSGGGGVVTYGGIFYCSGNCSCTTLSSTATAYVGGNCFHGTSNQVTGFANLYMVGTGTLTAPSGATLNFPSNLYINTSGKITMSGTFSFGNSSSINAIINLIRGTVDASKANLVLPLSATHTLTNMNKIAWANVTITTTSSPPTLIMNEFFCGKPNVKTNVSASSTTNNYTVTFTDNFEKITKFVNISGCTLTRPQQLLVITDSKKSSTNRGIRYINSLPNGISKGDPSIQNILTPGQSSNLLVGDPAFVKSI